MPKINLLTVYFFFRPSHVSQQAFMVCYKFLKCNLN